MQCEFATDYFDHQTKDKISYECTETAESSKYCIFHDKENFKKNIQKINTGVKEKINYAILNNTAITMIGYNIAKIDITKKKFYNSVKFVKSIFHEEASFHNSEFLNHVDFSNAQFKEDVIFMESSFKNNIDFFKIKIERQGTFSNCIFKKKINFNGSELHNCGYFNCIFSEADFSSISSTENISFHTTIFNEEANFSDSKFDIVNFKKARFYDKVDLDAEFLTYANIHNVIFFKPELVNLTENLSNISFLGTNITRIRFSNEAIWNKEPLNPFGRLLYFKAENEKYKIYDERRLEEGFKDGNIETILDVYRNLRENHDFFLQYNRSSEFFVREMNMRKNYENSKNEYTIIQKKYFKQRISFLNIYNFISQYGNSIWRPTFILTFIISISTIAFLIDDFTNIEKTVQQPLTENVENAVTRSLKGFIPFTIIDDIGIKDIILKITILPILGMLLIAFRRKFERIIRH